MFAISRVRLVGAVEFDGVGEVHAGEGGLDGRQVGGPRMLHHALHHLLHVVLTHERHLQIHLWENIHQCFEKIKKEKIIKKYLVKLKIFLK